MGEFESPISFCNWSGGFGEPGVAGLRRGCGVREQPRAAVPGVAGAARSRPGRVVDRRPGLSCRPRGPDGAVLDGHPPTLALLATINQVRSTALGVSRFRAGRFDRGRLPVPQHRHRQHRPRRARRHRLTAATAMEAVSSRLLANLAGHARCCPAPIRSVRRHRRHHEGSPS